ncbi:hypothetical protein [Neochlamydia sp. S13]|uniref:hypothetical protein n=1 Tax=Neochlamydia sp. S13 TaxID=1353976 RepID=UPI0005A9E087|nr:hypothetical protein [Neochlamydia sp. S13]BBI16657.1 hypothetical protein NCS13_1_0462 [Neochlamydia sp. S13]
MSIGNNVTCLEKRIDYERIYIPRICGAVGSEFIRVIPLVGGVLHYLKSRQLLSKIKRLDKNELNEKKKMKSAIRFHNLMAAAQFVPAVGSAVGFVEAAIFAVRGKPRKNKKKQLVINNLGLKINGPENGNSLALVQKELESTKQAKKKEKIKLNNDPSSAEYQASSIESAEQSKETKIKEKNRVEYTIVIIREKALHERVRKIEKEMKKQLGRVMIHKITPDQLNADVPDHMLAFHIYFNSGQPDFPKLNRRQSEIAAKCKNNCVLVSLNRRDIAGYASKIIHSGYIKKGKLKKKSITQLCLQNPLQEKLKKSTVKALGKEMSGVFKKYIKVKK